MAIFVNSLKNTQKTLKKKTQNKKRDQIDRTQTDRLELYKAKRDLPANPLGRRT